jgi:hypothetical protein
MARRPTKTNSTAGQLDDSPDPQTGMAGNDEPVDISEDDLSVIDCVDQFFTEAERAQRIRRRQSQANWDTYMGLQDWSGKVRGQSREFIPKVPIAVDQLCFFVKKALTGFGDWFQVSLSRNVDPATAPLTGEQIRDLLQLYLNNIPDGENKTTTFDVRASDALKVGLLQSLMIFKVYGSSKAERRYGVEEGKPYETPITQMPGTTPIRLTVKQRDRWYLNVDLIRPEDYYPDPSGNGLYEIHKSEHDLHHVVELAEQGIYDMDVVDQLHNNYEREYREKRRDSARGQERSTPPGFRKKVVIKEFWGTLLNSDGRVAQRNVVCAIANDRFLIRRPEPNPFWHGESPFVACPIIRVPFSVWHKAVFDHAASLNIAINEIFNLMIDGGIASVWGTKQIRTDMLVNPEQVTDGVPQGITLDVKNELPFGQRVMENLTEGQVPQDAMAMFEAMTREFESAALTNELRMGQMPAKRVAATEVNAMGEGQSVTLEGITGVIEQDCFDKVLRKAWLCILQDADNLLSEDVVNAIGATAAVTLRRMSPARRFAQYATTSSIEVGGISAIIAKLQDFQKQGALMQIVMSNPLLMQAYQRKYSSEKQLEFMMKSLNINPEDVEKTPEEIAQNDAEMARTQQASNIINGPGGQQGGQGVSQPAGNMANAGQGAQVAGQINQQTTPATGMT